MPVPKSRRALVLGCGGPVGFTWSVAALREAERQLSWDARDADMLVGTSAGAELAAMLGAGHGVEEILGALSGEPVTSPVLTAHLVHDPGSVPPLPSLTWPGLRMARSARWSDAGLLAVAAGLAPRGRGDATWLRDLGARLEAADGWVEHPATWIMATDVATSRRVAFGSREAPPAGLGEAIAASWAVPGWFPPVAVGNRTYLDGGTVSPVSADLLIDQDVAEVVLVAPMSTAGGARGRGLSRLERLLRAHMTRRVDLEVHALRARGIRVIRIEPGVEELDAMGANFMDIRRRGATLQAASRVSSARVHAAVRASGLTDRDDGCRREWGSVQKAT